MDDGRVHLPAIGTASQMKERQAKLGNFASSEHVARMVSRTNARELSRRRKRLASKQEVPPSQAQPQTRWGVENRDPRSKLSRPSPGAAQQSGSSAPGAAGLVSLAEVGLLPPAEAQAEAVSLQPAARPAAQAPAAVLDDDDDDEDVDVSKLLRSPASTTQCGLHLRHRHNSGAEEMAAMERLLDGLDEGYGWSVPLQELGPPKSCRSSSAMHHPLADVVPVDTCSKVYFSSKSWFSA